MRGRVKRLRLYLYNPQKIVLQGGIDNVEFIKMLFGLHPCHF